MFKSTVLILVLILFSCSKKEEKKTVSSKEIPKIPKLEKNKDQTVSKLTLVSNALTKEGVVNPATILKNYFKEIPKVLNRNGKVNIKDIENKLEKITGIFVLFTPTGVDYCSNEKAILFSITYKNGYKLKIQKDIEFLGEFFPYTMKNPKETIVQIKYSKMDEEEVEEGVETGGMCESSNYTRDTSKIAYYAFNNGEFIFLKDFISEESAYGKNGNYSLENKSKWYYMKKFKFSVLVTIFSESKTEDGVRVCEKAVTLFKLENNKLKEISGVEEKKLRKTKELSKLPKNIEGYNPDDCSKM
jgi:hypothetical protein